MKKLLTLLLTIFLVISLFVIYQNSIHKEFEVYLNKKYPAKTFHMQNVKFNIKILEAEAYISCSDGTSFKINKKSNEISDNYLGVKYTKIITDNISEMLSKNELLKYIKSVEVKILDNINYINDETNPQYYLTIAYNDYLKTKNELADVTYKIINRAKETQYNKVDTYVFFQDRNNQSIIIELHSEDINITPKDILNKIKVVEEVRIH